MLSLKNIITLFLVWLLTLLMAHVAMFFFAFHYPLRIAIIDSVVFNGLTGICCLLITQMLYFYKPAFRSYWVAVLIELILAALSVLIGTEIIDSIIDDEAYSLFLSNGQIIRFAFHFLIIAAVGAITWFWYQMEEQKDIQQRHDSISRLTKEAELLKLRQQLQPHFLFNSLNSINALIGSRPEEARRMLHQLSDFLRGTLKKDDQALTSVEEEIQHLQLYLEIEKVRFAHRLNTEISIDEGAGQMQIPSLILQPLVENAIKFGLYDTIGVVTISIEVKLADRYIELIVKNPFDDQTNYPEGTGFGLSSISRRLYLLYARNDLLLTQKNKGIFLTKILIPQV